MIVNNFVVGLTGGIGSGKTTVENFLSSFFDKIIDADIVSRDVLKNKNILIKLKNNFPDCFINEKFDRKKMRIKIFNDSRAYELLNDIIMPNIIKEINLKIKNINNKKILLIAPLLIESGLYKQCNIIITISCEDKIKIKRVIERDIINENLMHKILERQLTDKEREKFANYIIYNEKDLIFLKKQIIKIIKEIENTYNIKFNT